MSSPSSCRARRSIRVLAAVALAASAAGIAACTDLFRRADHYPGDTAWRVPYDDQEWWWQGQPAVEGDRVFFVAHAGVVAFDARDGAPLWTSASINDSLLIETPAINVIDGKVFAAGQRGVFSFDATTGATRWLAFAGNRQFRVATNAVDHEQLYVADQQHHVYALGVDDGRVRWSTDVGADWRDVGVAGGLAVQGDTVYVAETRVLDAYGTRTNALFIALDRRDGHELWRLQLDGNGRRFYSAPVVVGRLVIAADSWVGGVFAVDRFTGTLAWHFDTDPYWSGINTTPVVIGNELYAGAGDTWIYGADVNTGRVNWKSKMNASITALGACGRYLWATLPGAALVDRHTGEVKRLVATADDRMVTSNYAVGSGRIFAAGHNSMYAFWC